MSDFINTFNEKFILDFIEKDRWKFITGGLKITLIVTFFALVFGILIGMIVAIKTSLLLEYYHFSAQRPRAQGGVAVRFPGQSCQSCAAGV